MEFIFCFLGLKNTVIPKGIIDVDLLTGFLNWRHMLKSDTRVLSYAGLKFLHWRLHFQWRCCLCGIYSRFNLIYLEEISPKNTYIEKQYFKNNRNFVNKIDRDALYNNFDSFFCVEKCIDKRYILCFFVV